MSFLRQPPPREEGVEEATIAGTPDTSRPLFGPLTALCGPVFGANGQIRLPGRRPALCAVPLGASVGHVPEGGHGPSARRGRWYSFWPSSGPRTGRPPDVTGEQNRRIDSTPEMVDPVSGRDRQQRRSDALLRLHDNRHLGLRPSGDGVTQLVFVFLCWFENQAVAAVPRSSRTGANVRVTGRARLAAVR